MRRKAQLRRTLAQLPEGESGVLDRLDLPDDIARRLMELGFLPGHILFPPAARPAANRAFIEWMAQKWRCGGKLHRA